MSNTPHRIDVETSAGTWQRLAHAYRTRAEAEHRAADVSARSGLRARVVDEDEPLELVSTDADGLATYSDPTHTPPVRYAIPRPPSDEE